VIWYGNEDAILTLLDRGAEVKTVNKDGVDINATNNKGNTPLYTAVKRGDAEVVRLLLNRGPIPDIKNNKGKAPADLPKKSTNVEIKKLFGILSP